MVLISRNCCLYYGDLTDSSNLTSIHEEVQPDEVYNPGAQSHVAVSFELPQYSAEGLCDCHWSPVQRPRSFALPSAGSGKGREEESIIEALAIPHPLLSIGEVIVRIDPCYFRPAEVESLLGDPANAKAELGRVPEITLDKMVEKMVAHDLDLARCHALL